MNASNQRHEIAIVDTSIAGYQSLIDAAGQKGMEIIRISGDGGMEQIAQKLEGRENIGALHLFSHGSEGQVYLGGDILSSDTLDEHNRALTAIKHSLSEEGDILLYGCDVAQGDGGQRFIEKLALLSSADVAASDDKTGVSGNWALESYAGKLEFEALEVTAFQSDLAVETFDGYNGGTSVGEFNVAGLSGDGATAYLSNTAADATFSLSSGNGFTFESIDISQFNPSFPADVTFTAGGFSQTVRVDSANPNITFQPMWTNVPQLTISVSGGDNPSLDNLTFTEIFPPTDISIDNTSVTQSSGTNAAIGNLGSVDSDSSSFTYSLVTGGGSGDNSLFNISSGALVATDALAMSGGNYNVRIQTSDEAGNTYQESFSITVVDDVSPTVTSIVPSGSPTASDTSVDFDVTFNESVDNVTIDDFSLATTGSAAGNIASVSGSGSTYTLTVDSITGEGTLRADLNGSTDVQDTGANLPGSYTSGAVHTVDRIAPTVSDTHIALSGASGTGDAFKVGDTVTATWDNTADGDNNSDTIDSVSMDFSGFGGGPAVAASNSGGIWTATYTVTENGGGSIIDGTDTNVSVTAIDDAGNPTTATDTTNATVDNDSPSITDGNLNITTTGTGSGGAFLTGDNITVEWHASTDGNSDIATATADFSAFGGGAPVAMNDVNSDGSLYSASYTLTSGSVDGTDLNIRVNATDDAGNTTTRSDSSNLAADTAAPTISDAHISLSGATGTGGAFRVGDTVTTTWNDTATGDNNSDTISSVSVDFSGFGGGAAVAASNSGDTWTATYTITENGGAIIDGTNINVTITATDDAGLTASTTDTTGATVDNDSPGPLSGPLNVDENSANSTAVGSVSGGGNDGISYRLTDNAGGRFAIDGSGNVTVTDGSSLDHESNPSHNITVRATDDAGNTTENTVSVTVNNINEAPSLIATGGNPVFIEGDVDANLFNATTANTEDNGQTFASLTLTVTNVVDGADEILRIDGSDLALTNGNSIISATNNLDVSASLAGSTATVSFSGANLSEAAMQTLMDDLAYLNTSENPTTGANRVVTITEIQDDGSAINTATPTLQSTVNLTPVNDAPTAANVAGDSQAMISGNGPQVTSLFDDAIVSDPENHIRGGMLTITQSAGNNGNWGLNNGTSGADNVFGNGETVIVSGVTIGTVTVSDGQNGNNLGIILDASVTEAQVSAFLADLTYDPTTSGTGVRAFALSLSDGDGTSNGGAESSTSGAFTITVTGSPPVISGLDGGLVTFTEESAPVRLDSDGNTSITDIDSSDFNGGTITASITGGGTSAEDKLKVVDSADGRLTVQNAGTELHWDDDNDNNTATVKVADIAGGSNGDDLVLTLTASARPGLGEAIEAILRNIAYENTNTETPSTANRILTVQVKDSSAAEAGVSALSTVTVGVTERNDAPTLTATSSNPTFTEGNSAAGLFSNTNIDTVETDDNIEQLVLKVAGLTDGADEKLSIDDETIVLTDGNTGTTVANGFAYSVNLNGKTATIILSENDTPARWQALMNGVGYLNTSDNPDTGARTVTVDSITDTGGTENLNEGDPDDDGDQLTYTLDALPTSGALSLNGVELAENDTFTQQDIDNDLLTFTAGGHGTASFDITLADGGENGASPVSETVSVNVTAPTTPRVPAPTNRSC